MGPTIDSQKLEHGRRVVYAGVASFFGLWLEDGHEKILALAVLPESKSCTCKWRFMFYTCSLGLGTCNPILAITQEPKCRTACWQGPYQSHTRFQKIRIYRQLVPGCLE